MVVVSHNRVEALRRCLASLEKSAGRETLQVIVVDNGSRDGSAQLADEFANVQWIRLPKNFGLTKAWNLGWRAADAAYVFFLHADTEVEPGTVPRLAEMLDANEEAVAVCPLLVDAEGRPAQLGKLPPDGNWRPAETGGGAPVEVEYPRGAALMARVFYIKRSGRSTNATGSSGRMPTWPCRSGGRGGKSCWCRMRACGTTRAPAIHRPKPPIFCWAGRFF